MSNVNLSPLEAAPQAILTSVVSDWLDNKSYSEETRLLVSEMCQPVVALLAEISRRNELRNSERNHRHLKSVTEYIRHLNREQADDFKELIKLALTTLEPNFSSYEQRLLNARNEDDAKKGLKAWALSWTTSESFNKYFFKSVVALIAGAAAIAGYTFGFIDPVAFWEWIMPPK